MIPSVYNFKEQYAGDTFNGLSFELKRNNIAIDLTDVAIRMQIKKGLNGELIKELTINNGITIVDALLGKFKIEPFINPSFCFKFYYDMQFTYLNGVVKTYIKGIYPVSQDVTR